MFHKPTVCRLFFCISKLQEAGICAKINKQVYLREVGNKAIIPRL